MKVRYIKSSTTVIEANDVRILTDPWLLDGEYYGSWYHYPQLEIKNEIFEEVDFIYVSHIHPDHFSKSTFKMLNKNIPVLIHSYASKFLKENIERAGFKVVELKHNSRTHLKNGVYINILAADNCNPELCLKFFGCSNVEIRYGSTQIDSLCVIDDGIHTIVNTNDCPFDLATESLRLIKEKYLKVDFLMVGYGGAGPYPQCFVMSENARTEAAAKKKKQFLDQGLKFINELQPEYSLPFAGAYVLGGKLARLQKYRGVAEPEEAEFYFRKNLPDHLKVILLNSYEYFDLRTGKPSNPYLKINQQEKEEYINNVLSEKKLSYEIEEQCSPGEIIALIPDSYKRFEDKRKEIAFRSETQVLIYIAENCWCVISNDGKGFSIISDREKEKIKKFVSYKTDIRLLKKILMGPRFAHWNNAEIGSHIEFERFPDVFERGLYHAMCFFHV